MNPTEPALSAPFPADYRASGVLLHVTSLPSPYGIGDLGPGAFAWVDRLAAAAQSWWQLLPLGPTGEEHSPYQALSSFAVNPLILSPDRLIEDGLIKASDCGTCSFPTDYVDFERVIPFKEEMIARAWRTYRGGGRADLRDAYERFCEAMAHVQDDAALFMALKARLQGMPFQQWPAALARRDPAAIAQAREDAVEAIDQFRFGQFLLVRQFAALKEHAGRRGVRLLGDLPIFVSPDSADVWAHPELFLLDGQLCPRVVAGVPPDYFCADGQHWGNPIYDWDAHRATGYRWWIERLQLRLKFLDLVRIDHFRGFEAAWHIPAGAATAATGQWVAGPGAAFFEAVRQGLKGLPLLAEDLGIITPEVTALRDQFQLPGMRVLQFAFNGDPENPHLPHHFAHNGVAYTGTHDNDTTRGWYDHASEHERRCFWSCAGRAPGTPEEAVWEMIRLALTSPAALAVVPLQDVLGLDSAARLNMPGRADGQWRWRFPAQALDAPGWQRLHELTLAAERAQETGTIVTVAGAG